MSGTQFNIDYEAVSKELKVRPEILEKLIRSFANSLPDKLVAIDDGLNEMDREKMRVILHEIKGTASNLRLDSISTAEEAMHLAVKTNEPKERLEELLEALKTRVEELQSYLNN